MILFTRRKNESVVIDDRITVTVVEIRGDKVRLQFEAPKDMSVHRSEVYWAIQGLSPSTRTPSNPPVPVSDSPKEEPPPSSCQITLSTRQTALIDRFRSAIGEATGTEPSRESAIKTLFRAIERADRNLAVFIFNAARDRGKQ